MAVSIITALRKFNMNTDEYVQIKNEPFESSTDLYQLESRSEYSSTFNDFSYRRSSECSECNGRPDYECTSCMCQVCFHKTNAEKRYRCFFCRKAFHEWCRNNRDIITENRWLCAECKEYQDRKTPQYCNITDEFDIKDFDVDLKPSEVFKKEKGTVDVNCNTTLGNDDSDSMETEDNLSEFNPLNKVCTRIIRKMNNAPRSKICITVPSNHFGPIPGVPVGTCWKYRLQASESGVHRPLVAGIHGRENEGAYSIVLSGVYEDDQDDGEEFFYSGCGGKEKDPRKRLSNQVADQTLKRHNKALALCCNAPFNDVHGAEAEDWRAGKPVRVIRNYKLGKFSIYAPEEGNRYDGIYKVVKYFPTIGKSGLLIWRYLLRRDDPSPAPWTDEGKRLIQEKNLKVIYPEEEVMNEEYYSVTKYTKKIKQELEMSVRKRPYDYTCYQCPDDNKLKLKHTFLNSESISENNSPAISESIIPNVEVETMLPINNTIPQVSSNDTQVIQCTTDQEKQNEVIIKSEKGFELPENTNILMNMDRWNKSIWDYCKTYLNISENEFLSVVKLMFTCPCCFKLVDSPVTTPCEHNVCLECLSNHYSSKIYSCPQCHYFLDSSFKFRENKYLSNILETLFPGYNFKLSKFI